MRLILATIMCVLVFASGCQKSEFLQDGEFFHLSHKGAKMPVWVKGNFNSDIIIITVHGGPGDSGMEQPIATGFKYLEEDYLMVHWDQRWSGMTQGHYDKETMTPDQFIEDTDMIVKLIESKYPGKTLFMLGHSWGGQLSAGYLGRDNNAANFNGWIDLDSSIYGDIETQEMKTWVLDRVPAELEKPDVDLEFWENALRWYDENPNPGNYSSPEPYWFVSALGGDAYDWEAVQAESPTPYGELIFRSMFAFSWYVNSFTFEDQKLWDEINYTPELNNMTIPALMLWGADDGIVPTTVADYVYDNLATPPANKSVVKLPECGHGPQHEQPEMFYDEIKQFVETYK